MIYYAYERATGAYAGSGTPEIDTPTHTCTTVPVPDHDDGQSAAFDPDAETWAVVDA